MTTTTELATASRDGFAEAERTARDYMCGDCSGRLTVLWRGDRYAAVCARWPQEHEHLKAYADAQADDVRQRIEASPPLAQTLANTGALMPLTTHAIKQLDNDKLMARVPTTGTDQFGNPFALSKELRVKLAQLARVYGLDPIWDLCIYQGNPYVTYDGRLRKLREHPDYSGHKVRPLSREEKEQWGYDPADLVIQCDVEMGPRGTISDWGIVRNSEIRDALDKASKSGRQSAPVGKHPQQIAIKRAVSRCSRQAVGIDLPTMIETSGRVIDVQENPPLPEDQARRRFWATARTAPPDGLGLAESEVHDLLGVQTLNGYPGGWEQALSDLTERAAARESADVTAPPAEAAPPETDRQITSKTDPLWKEWLALEAEARKASVTIDTSDVKLGCTESSLRASMDTLREAIGAAPAESGPEF